MLVIDANDWRYSDLFKLYWVALNLYLIIIIIIISIIIFVKYKSEYTNHPDARPCARKWTNFYFYFLLWKKNKNEKENDDGHDNNDADDDDYHDYHDYDDDHDEDVDDDCD